MAYSGKDAPDAPGAQDLGSKVSLRLHDPTGGYRDILGILESQTSIRRKNGLLVEFDPADIAIWRRVVTPIAKAGHGAPLSLRIKEIEQAASATWPAKEIEFLGDWVLRATGKFTMRANSVLALGNPGLDLDLALERVVDFYRARSLTPTIHVALPTYSELDEKLQNLGWSGKVHAQVMVADIESDILLQPGLGNWEVFTSPTDEWIAVQDDAGVQEIMQRAPAIYIGLRIAGQLVAVGRTAHSNGWTTLTRLYVKPELRGQGIGRELICRLLVAAKDAGISKAFLQVDLKNQSAMSLYEKLGFRRHHTYIYRTLLEPPSQESQC